MARKKLGEILMQAGVIDEMKLRAALAEQRRWGGQLGKLLIEMGVSEDAMVAALAAQMNFPTVNLDDRVVPLEVLELVSADAAESHALVPFAVVGKFLDVAMADPTNLGIIDELRIRTQLNVRPHLAGPKMLDRAIARLYGRGMEFNVIGDVRRTEPAGNLRMMDEHGALGRPLRESQGGLPGGAPRRATTADQFGSVALSDAVAEQELATLQARVQKLEALVARDEDVLRKLLALLVEKGLASREEILERLSG